MSETKQSRVRVLLPRGRSVEVQASEAEAESLDDREYVELPGAPDVVEFRVDWDGSAGYGSFELMLESSWHELPHPEATGKNDVISTERKLRAPKLRVRFERGPSHPNKKFKVRALPIIWLLTDEQLGEMRKQPDFVARRGVHYQVNANIIASPWSLSESVRGAERAELELLSSVDYELWTSLEHPTDPKAEWLEQDPIWNPVYPKKPGSGK